MMMGKREFKMVFLINLALILSVFQTGVAGKALAENAPIVWRLQSAWPTTSAIHPATAQMCRNIKDRSGGRLVIKLFGPGEIVSSVDCLDAVRNGVIEFASGSGIYNSSKIPEGLIEFGLPFGLEDPAQLKAFWYTYKNGENFKLVREAYREKDVELLHIRAGLSYGYMTKFPVNRMADFKGKRIRSFGYFGAVIAKAGGVPVSLPTEDQYMALEQGAVDGTIFPYLAMETMNFKDMCKYLVLPAPLGAPTGNLFCSKKAFDRLPGDIQQMLREEVKIMDEAYLAAEGPLEADLIDNPAKHGIQVCRLPAGEVAQLRQACMSIWDMQAQKNDRMQTLVANLKSFLTVEKIK